MNLKKTVSSILVGAGAVAIGLSLQYALADWSSAPSNPPSNNVSAPINISGSYQAKSGGLTLGSATASSSIPLDVQGVSYLESLILGQNAGSTFQYLDGNEAAGKVLTSDASGNATWQSAAGSSSSTPSLVYINPEVLVSIPGNTDVSWTTVTIPPADGIPSNASAIILQTRGSTYNQTQTEIDIRANSSSPTYTALYMGSSQYSTNTSGAQGVFPVYDNNGTFQFDYQVPVSFANGNATISLIGYVPGSGGGTGAIYIGGVTGLSAGGNITISPSNGVGNVTISTTATQSTGTVGGGCYSYGSASSGYGNYSEWGNATCSEETVGSALKGYTYYIGLTCPSDYTGEYTAGSPTAPTGGLCIKN